VGRAPPPAEGRRRGRGLPGTRGQPLSAPAADAVLAGDAPRPLVPLGRFELLLALRYLTTRRKQAFVTIITSISVMGVAVGVAALIIGLSLATGIHQDIQARILGANAHITIFAPPGEEAIGDYRALQDQVGRIPGVAATAPVVFDRGLITSEQNSSGAPVFLKGIDPEQEQLVTEVAARFTHGSMSQLKAPAAGALQPIALGKDLARALSVGPGDPVRLLVPRARLSPWDLRPRSKAFTVVGIVDSGFYDYDATWAWTTMEGARALLGLGDEATVIEVRVSELPRVARVREAIRESLEEGYPVTDMMEMNRSFFSALRTEKLLTFLVIGLVVIVAALNIVSTLILMVMEKVRDIGTLVSMGATARSIMIVFMAQGVMIGLVGTGLGCAIGLSLAWALDAWKLIPLPADVYFIPYVPFRVRLLDVTLIAGTALLVSFLATIYPAWKASRLDPVEALRYE
jgi:lipoprotein-releasing system permease protein